MGNVVQLISWYLSKRDKTNTTQSVKLITFKRDKGNYVLALFTQNSQVPAVFVEFLNNQEHWSFVLKVDLNYGKQ